MYGLTYSLCHPWGYTIIVVITYSVILQARVNVCMLEVKHCICTEMAADMNACMCVVFHCVCIYVCIDGIQSLSVCVPLYSAKGIDDVALNKK